MPKNIQPKLFLSLIVFTAMSAQTYAYYLPAQLDQFEKTNICINCDLSKADISSHNHNNANLSQSLLVAAKMHYSDFNAANFTGAQLMYAHMEDVSSSGSLFNSADLTGADLSRGNFSSSDFTGATLTGVKLENAILARAKISVDQLSSAASLSCAILPDGTKHASDSGSPC